MLNLKKIKPFYKNSIKLDDTNFTNKDSMYLLHNFLNHAKKYNYKVYFILFDYNSMLQKFLSISKIKHENGFTDNYILYINNLSSPFHISRTRSVIFFEFKDNFKTNNDLKNNIEGSINIENFNYYCDYLKSYEINSVCDYATQYGINTSSESVKQFLEAKLILDIINSETYKIKGKK